MNIEDLRIYILSKEYVTEDMPFDATTLAFRIGNKIFGLTGLDRLPLQINLKCDPERVEELRENYSCVIPGYHMNKKHWNTLILEDDCTWSLVKELVDHSYDLVYASLPKKVREELG